MMFDALKHWLTLALTFFLGQSCKNQMYNLKKKSDKLLNTISITGIYFLKPASLQKLVLSIWVFSMDGHYLYLIVPF